MVDSNRIALVTGANKGIGLEIARQLAQARVFVIMGARDPGRARAAVENLSSQGLAAQSVLIDLNDQDSIAAAAQTISAQHGRLDILVNNAGTVDAEDGPPTASSPEAARRIMDTNFIGTLAVTQAMLPLLRRSPAGRIVNLSSSLGSLTLNGDPSSPYYSARLIGYNASKAALNMLTVQLSAELRDTAKAFTSRFKTCPNCSATSSALTIEPSSTMRCPDQAGPVKMVAIASPMSFVATMVDVKFVGL